MANHTITVLAIALLLVPVLGSTTLSDYIKEAYGVSYPPSFGGGTYQYTDGLVINGKTFDISGYSQTIPTQNLTVGVPSSIALKIYDNAGSYTIRSATLYLNIRGPSASVQNSDTSIQYDVLSGKTIIQDPHHFIATATGSASLSGKFAYVTFSITPGSKMNTSDMIVSAVDDKSSVGYSLIVDAVSFTGKTSGDPTHFIDYTHQICTVGEPCQQVCGNHVCAPGEKPQIQVCGNHVCAPGEKPQQPNK
jgi:hypothetical protein